MCARHIDAPLLVQQSDGYAVRAKLACMGDLLAHHLELEIGIAEVAAARANHDEQADGNPAANRSDQSRARGDSSFQQIGAEFNALRTSALGRDRRLHRINADFKVHDDGVPFPKGPRPSLKIGAFGEDSQGEQSLVSLVCRDELRQPVR